MLYEYRKNNTSQEICHFLVADLWQDTMDCRLLHRCGKKSQQLLARALQGDPTQQQMFY